MQTQTTVPVGATQPQRTEKKCPACKTVKPLTEFHLNCVAPDGRRNVCAACVNLERRENPAKRYGCARDGLPPKKFYTRDCNRCDARYTGEGRLLCPKCVEWANASDGGVTQGGFASAGWVPRRGGA